MQSYAQFNDSIHYYTGFISTGNYNRTNTGSSYTLSNAVKLQARKKNIEYNFNNRWLYGRQNGALMNNDFSSALDANLYKTFPHFNYWVLLVYNSGYSLKINNQLQAGAGIAYSIIDQDNMQVNISDGLLYDYSDLTLPEGQRELYSTIRNSLRLRIKWQAGKRFSFSGVGFYQHSLQYDRDFIVRSDVYLNYQLKKWLILTAGFTYNEISRTQSANLFANYGLTLETYF